MRKCETIMRFIFDILRRESPDAAPYHQQIPFETGDSRETVATALRKINAAEDCRDLQNRKVEPIAWEAGCLQKKCGACAMLINLHPALACDSFLAGFASSETKTYTVFLAPLSKFPVVKDLLTDRSVLFDNLKTLKQWSGENGEIKEKNLEIAYEASRCLQCGCCLEACPNYSPGGTFFGAAGYAPQGRLISTYSAEEQRDLRKLYLKHIYDGCGKALSCQKVCPAGIDLDRLLSRTNAISVWRRR